MRTVICHFYNEEYLLPFWLRHHRNLFDHGIMINHRSDDNSVNIIRELTPHWSIVNTKLNHFDASGTDNEVMTYERSISDWKMALNVTEFLLPAAPMDEIQAYLENNNLDMGRAKGYSIVDNDIINEPKVNKSLPSQKHYGCLDFIDERNRIIHKKEHGNYHLGRHGTYHGSPNFTPSLFLFHYGFCPWNEPFIKRRLQIASRISESDRIKNRGWQHFLSTEKLEAELQDRLIKSQDLSDDPEIKLALDFVKSYY